MNEYDKQAKDFLEKTESEIFMEYMGYDYYFYEDKNKRDIYEIELKRGNRGYKFTFGRSLANSGFFMTTKTPSVFNKQLLIDDNYPYAIVLKHKEPNSINVKGTNLYIKPTVSGAGLFYGGSKKWSITQKKPTEYDILTCLQGYEVGSFEDFCDDFGYDNDSINALKIYEKVADEFKNLCLLYSDSELEILSEIQ